MNLVPYGSRTTAPAKPKRTDRRYHTARWRRVREQVLRRDGHRCRIVPGCDLPGNVADHINPVYPGMPDAEFYDPRNLQAACWPHNRGKAFEAAARRRAGQPRASRPQPGSRTVTADFTRRPSGVITADYTRPETPSSRTITADFTRREPAS